MEAGEGEGSPHGGIHGEGGNAVGPKRRIPRRREKASDRQRWESMRLLSIIISCFLAASVAICCQMVSLVFF